MHKGVFSLLHYYAVAISGPPFTPLHRVVPNPDYLKNTFKGTTRKAVEKARRKIRALISVKQCAPMMLRLAWHSAGTFDVKTKNGGPFGTMRHALEQAHGANKGLEITARLLEPIKEQFPIHRLFGYREGLDAFIQKFKYAFIPMLLVERQALNEAIEGEKNFDITGLVHPRLSKDISSRQASTNRNTEVEGPGTGPSKHGGGSVSFVTTNERLGWCEIERQTEEVNGKVIRAQHRSNAAGYASLSILVERGKMMAQTTSYRKEKQHVAQIQGVCRH
ncbi:hypothetical protein Syun_009848 [Stephania yunnanensis]|uniref:Plant heme peroxidase family profile domain-containing protein n=1 Tax=Stephania yunnanensis TaxID=152371 RepID=A0AAP0PR24_9MAGN